MYYHYVYWQFFVAPTWLIRLFWNLQRALIRLFSVLVMFRTLLSYWRRDKLSLQQGSIGGFFKAFGLNLISRLIGFIIRMTILASWLVSGAALLIALVIIFSLFVLWPFLAIIGFSYGLAIILG